MQRWGLESHDLTRALLQKSLKFGFKDYVVDDANMKRTAVCRVCSIKVSDTTTKTSNLIRHYKKTHRERNVLC